MSYKTFPRSKAQIRGFVNRVREIFRVKLDSKLPVLYILETLCSGLDENGYTLEIVPTSSMSERYAETIPEKKIVRIREDVYNGVYEEKPRDLFTVCHEIGHILLHSNDIISFARENENVKKEGANQGKIIMNNTGGNIIYSKQKEQNEDKKI